MIGSDLLLFLFGLDYVQNQLVFLETKISLQFILTAASVDSQ